MVDPSERTVLVPYPHTLYLSLSLSLSHTHTHTHTLSPPRLSLSPSLSRSLSLHSLSLSHTHTQAKADTARAREQEPPAQQHKARHQPQILQYRTDLCKYVQAYVTTLSEGSKVSLSQLKQTLIRFHTPKNKDDTKRIDDIFTWCKQKRNPGVRTVLRDEGFECPESTDHQLIVKQCD